VPRRRDPLAKAVELASDGDFRLRRAAYWRWQREFLRDGAYIDPDSIRASVEEMQDLVADEHRALRKQEHSVDRSLCYVCGQRQYRSRRRPLAPAALAAAFLSVGQFVAGEGFEAAKKTDPTPAALLIAGRKELGWA
jgi:hypothetical protein